MASPFDPNTRTKVQFPAVAQGLLSKARDWFTGSGPGGIPVAPKFPGIQSGPGGIPVAPKFPGIQSGPGGIPVAPKFPGIQQDSAVGTAPQSFGIPGGDVLDMPIEHGAAPHSDDLPSRFPSRRSQQQPDSHHPAGSRGWERGRFPLATKYPAGFPSYEQYQRGESPGISQQQAMPADPLKKRVGETALEHFRRIEPLVRSQVEAEEAADRGMAENAGSPGDYDSVVQGADVQGESPQLFDRRVSIDAGGGNRMDVIEPRMNQFSGAAGGKVYLREGDVPRGGARFIAERGAGTLTPDQQQENLQRAGWGNVNSGSGPMPKLDDGTPITSSVLKDTNGNIIGLAGSPVSVTPMAKPTPEAIALNRARQGMPLTAEQDKMIAALHASEDPAAAAKLASNSRPKWFNRGVADRAAQKAEARRERLAQRRMGTSPMMQAMQRDPRMFALLLQKRGLDAEIAQNQEKAALEGLLADAEIIQNQQKAALEGLRADAEIAERAAQTRALELANKKFEEESQNPTAQYTSDENFAAADGSVDRNAQIQEILDRNPGDLTVDQIVAASGGSLKPADVESYLNQAGPAAWDMGVDAISSNPYVSATLATLLNPLGAYGFWGPAAASSLPGRQANPRRAAIKKAQADRNRAARALGRTPDDYVGAIERLYN